MTVAGAMRKIADRVWCVCFNAEADRMDWRSPESVVYGNCVIATRVPINIKPECRTGLQIFRSIDVY